MEECLRILGKLEERITVVNISTLDLEKLHKSHGGDSACRQHFLYTQYRAPKPDFLKWFTRVVERIGRFLNHISWHSSVDLTRQLNKASAYRMTGLPCEIEGIDRNAMPSKARARIIRNKAKGFCCSSSNDLIKSIPIRSASGFSSSSGRYSQLGGYFRAAWSFRQHGYYSQAPPH